MSADVHVSGERESHAAPVTDAVGMFAEMLGVSRRTASRHLRAVFVIPKDKLADGTVSITKADRIIRHALYGRNEAVLRSRRVLRDLRWLVDGGHIDGVSDLLAMERNGVGNGHTCATCESEFASVRIDACYCSNACRQKACRQRKAEATTS